MRGVLALILLLVDGITNGHPQYGPGSGPGSPSDVIDTGCPAYTHDCVVYYQCGINGEIITDGSGLLDARIGLKECTNPEYPDVKAVCCRIPGVDPPPTPAPLYTCPAGQECVENHQCNADGTVNTDGTGNINVRVKLTSCYVDPDSLLVGVCCKPPIPPPVTICPGNEVCVADGQCSSADASLTGPSYTSCVLDVNTYSTGVCCDPPIPPPVTICPGNQACVAEGQCTSPDASPTGASYTSCILDANTYATGVCCDPPIPVLDLCPGDSLCLPGILCVGDVLDISNNYVKYGDNGPWSQCILGGDPQNKGVCCLNPVTEPPYNPYTPATKCGVRHHGLDVRSQAKLEKNEAQFGEFPWQAILFFRNFTFKCGASLVDDRWLITGAHCVNGYQYGDFRVRLGEYQVNTFEEPLPYLDVDIASITIHPGFNPDNLHNDVAVLELSAPVPLQYHINTVCLPEPGQIPLPGTRCFASGWGKDAFEGEFQIRLKRVDVPVVEYAYCQDLLRKTRLGGHFRLDKSFMCAGGEENKDACTGDGGGPLVCEDPASGSYFLQGITAWGIGCGQKDIPGVYADVQYFSNWINGIIYGQPVAEVSQPGNNPYGRK